MVGSFSIIKKTHLRARVGEIHTAHGVIHTPAFIAVGTKATVKALTVPMLQEIGVQAVLGNTYHLFLEPGHELIKEAGGLHAFMGWNGPIVTDSGGFQVFSLGVAMGENISKLAKKEKQDSLPTVYDEAIRNQHGKLAIVDEEGVSFTSYLDGTLYRFTPERSIEIQHALCADIIFAFDECTSPHASDEYQKKALDRTHRWAKQSLNAHRHNLDASDQMLFGIVQGGRNEALRTESATELACMDFDGYGIGGSFDKEDIHKAVRVVNDILPPEKPRHLLGIGEPEDLFGAIEHGVDTFDCVLPTRLGRTGSLYTHAGKITILNEKYRRDFSPVDTDCDCRVCTTYTRAYLAHLFRSKEMLGGILASYHNLYFITKLVDGIREALLSDTFELYRENFFKKYK